jgi:dTDP-4-amino-4,6-dideoxygalactose transaminase
MIPLFKVFMHSQAIENAKEVLASGYIGQGPKVEEFEKQLSAYMSGAEVLTVNSCTSALDLALHLCGVGPGDHVVTTPQTCTATNTMIVNRGAHPIWADIDPSTGNIDAEDVKHRITPKTKAIMAVDWGGRSCDYGTLKSYGLPVIEDAAHATGTTRGGIHVARSGGDYVCFSFQAIKHLTTGDGGGLIVPSDQIGRARLLRWYGLDRRTKASFRCEQNIEECGYKYHMNDIAAAIGIGNMIDLPTIVSQHNEHARRYCDALGGIPGLRVPAYDAESSWWIYSLLVPDPRAFMARMGAQGIDTSPVHARNDTHDAFARASCVSPRPLPGVDEFTAGHVAIPVGWWLTDAELQHVITSTIEAVAQ